MIITVNLAEFFQNNGYTGFTDNLASMLGISMDRIRIVGFANSRRRILSV